MRVSGWANSKKVHTSKANASSEVVWSIFPRYPLEQFVYVCIILFCSIPYYLRISSMICSIPRNWPWICHPLVQKCFLPNVENVEGSPPRFYLFWQLTKKLDQTDIMTIAYTAYQNITISLDLKMFTRHQNVSRPRLFYVSQMQVKKSRLLVTTELEFIINIRQNTMFMNIPLYILLGRCLLCGHFLDNGAGFASKTGLRITGEVCV